MSAGVGSGRRTTSQYRTSDDARQCAGRRSSAPDDVRQGRTPDDSRQRRTTVVSVGRRTPDDERQYRTSDDGRQSRTPDDVRQFRTTFVSARAAAGIGVSKREDL